ncbi:MAG: hypothetical protein IT317_14950 [Anaerolineales bacterium]|nr:hypothetical protein [Anaerolineales bacterium]
MAKTLKEFQTEFAQIKKDTHAVVEDYDEIENNIGAILEQMTEAFKVLGARIGELRAQGQTGNDLAGYMADREVASYAQELQRRRDTGKKTAAAGVALYTTKIKGLRKRLRTLREAIEGEISAREKKNSSKMLGLNQSVKEMKPLLDDVKAYFRNDEFLQVANYPEPIPAKQFDNVYEDLLTEQLNKTAKQVKKDEKLEAAKQRLNDKVLGNAERKAAGFVLALRKQNKLAGTAQKLKDINGLTRAKTIGGQAYQGLVAVVEPYEKIMASKSIKAMLAHSPDEPRIAASTKKLFDYKDRAKDDLDELNARSLAQ